MRRLIQALLFIREARCPLQEGKRAASSSNMTGAIVHGLKTPRRSKRAADGHGSKHRRSLPRRVQCRHIDIIDFDAQMPILTELFNKLY